ncbi:MAG: cupredoxin domain-containing protein [Magnetococcus sp. DMHC-6]
MNAKKLFTAFLAAAALTTFTLPALADQDPIADRLAILEKTDWKNMKSIAIELDEFSYTPNKLEFESGQAYKLTIKNIGEKKHYFTATEFFKAIATRKVESKKDAEIKVPYLVALELMANGGELDLYFVPIIKGTYSVFCTIDDHKKEGMEGTITIK